MTEGETLPVKLKKNHKERGEKLGVSMGKKCGGGNGGQSRVHGEKKTKKSGQTKNRTKLKQNFGVAAHNLER